MTCPKPNQHCMAVLSLGRPLVSPALGAVGGAGQSRPPHGAPALLAQGGAALLGPLVA
jgi:hypothetical protein